MKQIRTLQYEAIRVLYQQLRSLFGERASLSDINSLEREITTSTYRGPMSGNYRLPEYEAVDVRSVSTELGTIAADAHTLLAFTDEVGKTLGTFGFTTAVWYSYIQSFISEPAMLLSAMLSSSFIDGFTDEISIATSANTDATTATITEEGYITLQSLSGASTSKVLTPADIVVSRLGTGELTVTGDVHAMFNRESTRGVSFSIRNSNRGCGCTIDAKVEAKQANMITLRFRCSSALKVTIAVSEDGRTFLELYSDVTTANFIEVPFTTRDIRNVRISWEFSDPTERELGTPVYEIIFDAIRVGTKTRLITGVYETKPITLERDGTKAVSLVAQSRTIGTGAVRYFIGLVSGSDVSYIETTPGTTIGLGRRVLSLSPIGPAEEWAAKGDPDTGGRFYNILSPVADTVHLSTSVIKNGMFDTVNITVVPQSIKLYRGVNNYVRSSSTTQEISVGPLRHMPVKSISGKTFEPMPLLIQVTESIKKESVVGNRLYVSCLPSHSGVTIKESGELPFTASILGVGSEEGFGNYIELDAESMNTILSSNAVFTVTYATELKRYALSRGSSINLIPSSLSVRSGVELTYSTDYVVDFFNYTVIFNVDGAYFRECEIDTTGTITGFPKLMISYVMEELASSAGNYVWTTWIYSPGEGEITVLPFSTTEVAAGNFHRIDGIDVSSRTSWPISTGWHFVETTQPYPSVLGNSADVNYLTKVPSQAGLVFPPEVKQRAFRDSMRLVSEFSLATVSSADTTKCFTYKNGKLYVGYRPESVSYDMLNSVGIKPATGATLLCRKPVYAGDTYAALYYEPVPELFEIECEYEPIDEQAINAIIVRVELSTPEHGDSVIVERLGINRLNGVV